MPPLKAKALKNSSTISVSKFPSLSTVNLASNTKNGLPLISKDIAAKASSIGTKLVPYLLIPDLSFRASFKALPSTIAISSTVW
ncbi:hypothetical protein SDC9_197127 [bioreactor metagenome]|uniref:Uncharacterized protein n=1 Tax=bioreactor metagenome TaxID=1076179 RepID=A0A645IEY1_9ZZZZ